MKNNKYSKLAQKHLANGYSVEMVVAWWNKLVGNAEIKDGKALFYWHESVSDGRGGFVCNGKQFVILEVSA